MIDVMSMTADEIEQYLEQNRDTVLMFVDDECDIHTFEHEPQKDELCFVFGGSYGYDYDGSRAALENFAEQDADSWKLVPRSLETAERQRLVDGEYDSPVDWAESEIPEDT